MLFRSIHMMPEEVVLAAQELQAKKLLAVHWGKFALGNHAWDEPAIRVHKAAQEKQMNLLTPMIGERVNIDDPHQQFLPWWENIE